MSAAGGMTSARYYLLDVAVDLTAPAELANRLDRYFGRFRDPGACGWPAVADAPAGVFRCESADGGGWSCAWRGQTWTVRSDDAFEALFGVIQHAALARTAAFRLVHAAALVTGETGVLLAAPSSVGKSTLAMGLRQRGWTLLSDEAGALSRDTGRLHAFPRAVHLRPGSPALLGLGDTAGSIDTLGGEARCVIDAATPGRTAVPGAIVFLTPPPATPPRRDLDYVELEVDRAPEGLAHGLREIDAVRTVERLSGGGRVRLRLGVDRGASIAAGLDRVLAAAGVALRGRFAGVYGSLDFRSPPILLEIAPGEGVRRLLAGLLHGRTLARRTSPAAMGFELAALLNGVRWYTLVPGPLDETVACIAAAWA